MILKTNDKEVSLVPRTKKIVAITKKCNGHNLTDIYFKAVNENDIEVLSNIIFELAEDEDKKSSFSKIDDVYDFIDKWKVENKKTYSDLFEDIANMINDEGFFIRKMTQEELKEKLQNPLASLNINQTIKNSLEKVITDMVKEEFRGYKA